MYVRTKTCIETHTTKKKLGERERERRAKITFWIRSWSFRTIFSSRCIFRYVHCASLLDYPLSTTIHISLPISLPFFCTTTTPYCTSCIKLKHIKYWFHNTLSPLENSCITTWKFRPNSGMIRWVLRDIHSASLLLCLGLCPVTILTRYWGSRLLMFWGIG